jgi:hypothetical protein
MVLLLLLLLVMVLLLLMTVEVVVVAVVVVWMGDRRPRLQIRHHLQSVCLEEGWWRRWLFLVAQTYARQSSRRKVM